MRPKAEGRQSEAEGRQSEAEGRGPSERGRGPRAVRARQRAVRARQRAEGRQSEAAIDSRAPARPSALHAASVPPDPPRGQVAAGSEYELI